MIKSLQILTLAFFALPFLGCSPQLSQPNIEVPQSYHYDNGTLSGSDSIPFWWHTICDTTLRSLIDEALTSNRPTLAILANIGEAQLNLRIAKAKFLPGIGLELEALRYREADVYESEYQLTPTASWQIPLFGAYRSTKGVAQSQLFSTEWSYRAAILSLAGEVATTYYTLLGYLSSLRVSQESYILRRDATALIDSMYRHGMSSGVDLEQARSLVYAAAEDVESYREAVRLSELSLALLLSRNIEELNLGTLRTCCITQIDPLKAIPGGIPSDIIYNRPDLRESHYKLEEAMHKVGLARSAQFPSISLTADGGLFSTELKNLTFQKLLSWEWAAELTAPLFYFKSLRNKKTAAVKNYEATLLNYEQSILSALNDVESALVSINATELQRYSAKGYMESYEMIANSTRALYQGGMESYLNVVDAEREYYSARINYIELLRKQYTNYINLYNALGCSWERQ